MKADDKKLRVVLDTNVLVSALGFRGAVQKIWDLVEENQFEVFISPFIIEELQKNLELKAGLDPELIDTIMTGVRLLAKTINPVSKISSIKVHAADNRILECAVDAKADIIITGNMKHIRPLEEFRDIKILTPREFLNFIEEKER